MIRFPLIMTYQEEEKEEKKNMLLMLHSENVDPTTYDSSKFH